MSSYNYLLSLSKCNNEFSFPINKSTDNFQWLSDTEIESAYKLLIEKNISFSLYTGLIGCDLISIMLKHSFDDQSRERIAKRITPTYSSKKLLFILCQNINRNHWYLMIYYKFLNTIYIYDSLSFVYNPNEVINEQYQSYISYNRMIVNVLKQYGIVSMSTKVYQIEGYPRQLDGFSCGYRVITIMQCIEEQHRYSPLNNRGVLLFNEKMNNLMAHVKQ